MPRQSNWNRWSVPTCVINEEIDWRNEKRLANSSRKFVLEYKKKGEPLAHWEDELRDHLVILFTKFFLSANILDCIIQNILFIINYITPKTGLMFLRGPARRTLPSRGTKESGWEAQGKYSVGDRRGAKRDPQRGDWDIPGDPPGSLQLMCSGEEVLRRLEKA